MTDSLDSIKSSNLQNKIKPKKIVRSFSINQDLFNLFKAETARQGTTYSRVLEKLISSFLKNSTTTIN